MDRPLGAIPAQPEDLDRRGRRSVPGGALERFHAEQCSTAAASRKAAADELAALLAREPRRHETSVSEIVRRAVASFLGISGGGRRDLPFAALGRSGRRHTARDAEKILAAEWGHGRRR